VEEGQNNVSKTAKILGLYCFCYFMAKSS